MPCRLDCPRTCPIPGATGWSEPEGIGTCGVLLLGESLGEAEARDGLPFRQYAPAGSVVERAFRQLGYSREQFVLWNTIGCHPPGNKLAGRSYEGAAIAHCRPALLEVVERFKPRCILALGDTAFSSVSSISAPISYVRGYPVLSNIRILRGDAAVDVPVVGTFHPAWLRRGKMSFFGVLLHDLKLALDVAAGRVGVVEPKPGAGYEEWPDTGAAWRALETAERTGCTIYYDIETMYSATKGEDETEELDDDAIRSIQFWIEDHGYYFPWDGVFVEIARAILALPNPKVGCNNWLFDDRVLERNGVAVRGEVHDLRWMFHHLQPDLLTNLQFIVSFFGWPWPWKHLAGAEPRFYGIVDVDVLRWTYPKLRAAMGERGVWGGYEKQVRSLQPLLVDMSRRGMPVALADYVRVEGEVVKTMNERNARMQDLVPEAMKKRHPARGYVRTPKDTTGMVQQTFISKQGDAVTRWCRVLPFKPSHEQLIGYMRERGHTVPKAFKSEDETTAELELRRLAKATRDPLYEAVLEYREWHTIAKNHLPMWLPGPDNRVHPTFLFAPAQGQLSSRRPNAQNAPKRKPETAALFRSMVRARPGYILLEFDYKSFHPLTLGFEAGDKQYMRLARMDIHAFLAARLTRSFELDYLLGLGDDDLRDKLKWVREHHRAVRDDRAKRGVNGYGNGLGFRKLYYTNMESFDSQKQAKEVLDVLDATFPKVAAYKVRCRKEAASPPIGRGYLISRFGFIRWFWEVFKWAYPRGFTPGDDSEAAVAFLHVNDAFGIKKDSMLALEREGWLERAQLINEIHDALLFECPREIADGAVPVIRAIMETPSPVLISEECPGGLWCGVGVKRGESWDRMEGVS